MPLLVRALTRHGHITRTPTMHPAYMKTHRSRQNDGRTSMLTVGYVPMQTGLYSRHCEYRPCLNRFQR